MNIIDYTGTSLILSIRKYKGIISFKYVKNLIDMLVKTTG